LCWRSRTRTSPRSLECNAGSSQCDCGVVWVNRSGYQWAESGVIVSGKLLLCSEVFFESDPCGGGYKNKMHVCKGKNDGTVSYSR
jgi:hypothetical protein